MRVGLDIGSTTIKGIVLDDEGKMIFSSYERHYSHVLECAQKIVRKIREEVVPSGKAVFAISGSAGMGVADSAGVPFVQEVFAERVAAEKFFPDTDCIIELGGEDAKILFLTNGVEVRMNGSCAGGTGAFIDQMATLLKMDASQLDEAAQKAERTYTIASRCGVFAKSDVQPLINQGARTPDIAASIYQAVVNQTIAGLAQGRPIEGKVMYLGGPLTFSKCLRDSFDRTLGVKGNCPENSLYYVAMGAAYYADEERDLDEVLEKLAQYGRTARYASMPPLFENEEEYEEFRKRHAKASVKRAEFGKSERVHIGIDSGSTTIKIAVINEKGELLYTRYEPNNGNPIPMVKETLLHLYHEHPDMIVRSVTATGYGEELMKDAFSCDYGLVETVAHYTAARHFMPDVDFIIDIGGQDMKCFRIRDGAVTDIFLNEACSSGCGSFLQTFAKALGYTPEEFAKIGLFAKHPVDLGSRCTVFMNSSVKEAQKNGADLASISAGLSTSVVKNALYKVIRAASKDQLGKKIVVQGGTFYNEAVLRAFEKEMDTEVIRPDVAGLMGAYGAALYGCRKSRGRKENSTVLKEKELSAFEQKTRNVQCMACGNHCQLIINTFSDGRRLISGNRCEKPVTGKDADDSLDLYAYKLQKLEKYAKDEGEAVRGTIGIPLVLNMYELLPFWHTFWRKLGFKVKVSPVSSRKLYQKGQGTIPSDTACYPAKLTHGHIQALAEDPEIDAVFYPCMSYNLDEGMGDNHYNCPIVAYYPEVLADNVRALEHKTFIYDYVNLEERENFKKTWPKAVKKYFRKIRTKEIEEAIDASYAEYYRHMQDVREMGGKIIRRARRQKKRIIVLAGRPYHVDPEVNHGIDKLILHQGAAVVSEDSVCWRMNKFPTAVLNQWTYHARLYAAAKYCTTQKDMDLVQLVSFGCGLDAITTDETREILEEGGKLYTQLKIDEITNLGAVNIRIRSLFAALEEREEK